VSLPAQINAVTLVCRDVGRMAAFYRQFGWPEAPTSVAAHVVFQCTNGVVLSLFSEAAFDADGALVPAGFRGVTIMIACEDVAHVVSAYDEIRGFDDLGSLDEEISRSGFGSGFSFSDPEGNLWDVAHKYGSEMDDRGGYRYP
jgi:catechol 2,3-dioxygenase-like lactoylglutathione lyase family enzyme